MICDVVGQTIFIGAAFYRLMEIFTEELIIIFELFMIPAQKVYEAILFYF